jgi:hypothetical protein
MHVLAALLALSQAAAPLAMAAPGPFARAAAISTVATLRQTGRDGAVPAAELALSSAARGAGPTMPMAFACPPELCIEPLHPLVLGADRPAPRIKRSELLLRLLARTRVEPIASVASALSAIPLRVDWRPSIAEEGIDAKPGDRRGFGRLFVSLQFRLDANNVPVVRERAR